MIVLKLLALGPRILVLPFLVRDHPLKAPDLGGDVD
jgi:hypothetical protein